MLDMDEYRRWLSQADYTYGSAIKDYNGGDYSWCCFKCQQAAEYALKAVLKACGISVSGHSLLKLITEMGDRDFEISDEMFIMARELDRHYIPARYPDVYPDGSPYEYYDEPTAKKALSAAEYIIAFCHGVVDNDKPENIR